AAEMDAANRLARAEERTARLAAEQAERAALESRDAPLRELDRLADLLFRAALLAAGYRRHNRGEWRKRRVRRAQAAGDGGPDADRIDDAHRRDRRPGRLRRAHAAC